MACLRPPLSAIPAGAWYCPPCMDLHSAPAQNVNEVNNIETQYDIQHTFYMHILEEEPCPVNGCTIS